MRPVPIPDDLCFGRRFVIAGPDGDLTSAEVSPVEAVVVDRSTVPEGELYSKFNLRIGLEEGDLEKLRERPFIWIGLSVDRLPVFTVATESDRFVFGEDES